jgi:hypothetical protein
MKERRSIRKRSTKVDVAHKRWSDSQKIDAVTTYLKLGNISRTSEILKIPRPTIVSWRTTEWWKELEKDLRAEENIVLSSTMKGLVDKSLLAVEDRLDNGDWIYDNKLGKAVRKPVTMKDALSVSTNLMDKRIAIASTESYTVANDSIAEKLAKLAKSFEEFASAKPTVNVTDVIFVEEKKEP